MAKRLVPLGVLAVAVALLLGIDEGRAFPPPRLQNFEQYQVTCLGGAEIADPATLPPTPSCPGPEDKTPGATRDIVSGSILPKGQRLRLGYSYLGPGWPAGTTTVDGEKTAHNMTTHLDYSCDGVVDKLAAYAWLDTTATTEEALLATVGTDTIDITDSTVLPAPGPTVYIRIESTIDAGPPLRSKTETMILDSKAGDGPNPPGVVQDTMTVTRYDPSEHATGARIDKADTTTAGPNDFVMRTTSWGVGTGINGEDESYLDAVMPATLGTIASRARAAYTLFWYGGTVPIPLPPIPVNSVGIAPSWQPHASFSVVTFAGSPASPTAVTGTSNPCTQAPQGGKGLNRGQYGPNPATKGLYARWTTSIGEPDYSNGTLNFVYTTNCKAIKAGGDPNFVDDDNDCLATVANDGGMARITVLSAAADDSQTTLDVDDATGLAATDRINVYDEEEAGDADADGCPGVATVDDDGDGSADLNDPEVRTADYDNDGTALWGTNATVESTCGPPAAGGDDDPDDVALAAEDDDEDGVIDEVSEFMTVTAVVTADGPGGAQDQITVTRGVSSGAGFPATGHLAGDEVWLGVADPNDGNNDADGDGLMDGIEVAFGTCPGTGGDFDNMAVCSGVADPTDTDGDGNTDLEEMIGPSYLLTNPTDVDSDDDGEEDLAGPGTCNDGIDNGPDGSKDAADPDCEPFLDRNLKVDMYDTDADGPDGIQESGSPDGKPDFPDENGDRVVDSGFGPDWDGSADGSSNVRAGFVITGGGENDVCPNIADPGQQDFDDDGNGDACDPDDDNDGISDAAEATFKWDAVGGQCSNDTVSPTPLDGQNRDSDGDGFLDGVECKLGSNPNDIGDTPTADLSGDKDGLSAGQEGAFHISPFSLRTGQPDEDVDGDTLIGNDDRDSDGDGISDGCEVAFSNSNPTNRMSAPGVTDLLLPDGRPEVTEIGNGKGIADADGTMPGRDDLDGFDCDLDADNDGRSNSDEVDGTGTGVCDGVVTDWGIDTSYDDDGDGAPCLGCLGGSDSWADSNVDMVEDMDAGLEDVSDDLPGVQTLVIIDDGTALAAYDAPQPIKIESEEMTLISVAGDGPGLLRDSMVVTRAAVPVAHTATLDIEVRDDPPSWDTDGDGVLDGVECTLGTDPTDPLVKPDATACGGTADTDGDGLQDNWETCKWGTDPTDVDFDTDDDGLGDCVEACDVNGDSACDFVGDVIAHAKAALIQTGCPDPDPSVCFGPDGDFDINGDGSVDFVGDVIQEAKFGLIGTPGTPGALCQ